MDIRLITRHLVRQPELVAFAQRRVAFALSRFSDLVRGIDIRLDDINGPRGGMGLTCLVRLRLVHGGEISIEHPASSPEAAIAHGVGRMASRLRRLVSRHQDHR